MNTKALAGLGVVVALLAAWLLISMLNQPKVSVEKSIGSKPAASVSVPKQPVFVETTKEGEDKEVKTQVKVGNDNVKTEVKVK